MRSATPRALHRICGRTLIAHVVDVVSSLEPRRLAVVVGPDDDAVAKELDGVDADVRRVAANVRYDPCVGVLAALNGWTEDELDIELDPDDDDVLVVSASVPLLEPETVRAFYRIHRQSDAAATALVIDPTEDDAEMASAAWFVRRSLLAPALRRTDAPEIAAIAEVLRETGHDVAFAAAPADEVIDVRDRADLADAEAVLRARINRRWMRRGVTMRDPERTFIDATVTLDVDVTLASGVVLTGSTAIGAGSEIGPGCNLVDTRVGEQCRLEQTSAELATIADHARVGPFAVLAPGSEILAATVTGPFYTAGPDAR
jgi:bifunctional UDP-N-acetylglucosamine pyrophosphorylase/glucosamine-1-phosphate N-acetyltransferase